MRGVALPRVQPIIPTWRKVPFDDPEWFFEFKYDGFRGLCYLEPGRCRFISRNGNMLSRSAIPPAKSLAAAFGARRAAMRRQRMGDTVADHRSFSASWR